MATEADSIDVHDDAHFLRIALQASGVGVWSFIDGAIRWDAQTLSLFGTDRQPASFEEYLSLVHPDDRARVANSVQRFLITGEYEDIEHRVAAADGTNSERWLLCRGNAIRAADGRIRGLMGMTIDITERKRSEARLEALIITDDLTGLANRRRAHGALEREWRRCARLSRPLSLLMCDIDDFKRYNDSFGHPRGDECLRRVASALAPQCQRPTDLVSRYGGEEFLAILPETPMDGALFIAERMREAVAALGIRHAADAVADVITISVGIATCVPSPEDGDATRLLQAADDALYRAKRSGRNRVVEAASA